MSKIDHQLVAKDLEGIDATLTDASLLQSLKDVQAQETKVKGEFTYTLAKWPTPATTPTISKIGEWHGSSFLFQL